MASDLASYCPLSSISTNRGMSRIGFAPPAWPAWCVRPPIVKRTAGKEIVPTGRLVVTSAHPLDDAVILAAVDEAGYQAVPA